MFEVHQPLRLNRNFHQDMLARPKVGKDDLLELYFDSNLNRHIFDRATRKCYLPANQIILNEILRFKEESRPFRVAYGISGVFIEQCQSWNRDLLESFQTLADTECVEFLSETYYHSLSSLFGLERQEFIEQVKMHRELVRDLFGIKPEVFENTECLYNNAIAQTVAALGYQGVVTEGTERILSWRNPNFVYSAKGSAISVLLRNYQLSDDIGFRFSSRWWSEWPLTAQKYASWLGQTPGDIINIFIDYETFGEHHWPESGIHDFLKWLPREVLRWKHLTWSTPSQVIKDHQPVGEIDVHEYNTVSWADLERDPSAWLGNPMQLVSHELLKGMESLVKGSGDSLWLRLWRYFQMSDHLYYMSIKSGGSGDVHTYFNPSGNPIDAFISFSSIISDFQARVLQELQKPELAAKWIMRRLPSEKGFTFFQAFARPTSQTAASLTEFLAGLEKASIKSIEYHIERGDFERWISQVLGDTKLAEAIGAIGQENYYGEKLRKKLTSVTRARTKQLRTMATSVGV
ncbi:MAG: DUF5752 family protein [Promethearchaeota archaeon]